MKYPNYLILPFIFCGFIGTSYAAESHPPVLTAVTVDKTLVDVISGAQTVTFLVNVTDESGINWSAGPNRTTVTFESPTSGYKWATGSNDNPGELSVSFNQGDEGAWTIRWVEITDIYGNLVRNHDASSLGLPSHIYIDNGLYTGTTPESKPPIIYSASVDQTLVDVSSGAQTVTFLVNVTDESGINWSAGPNRTTVTFESPTSGYKWATGSNDNPGELSVSFNQGDEGAWTIKWVEITDIYGNLVRNHDASSLGLPSQIKVIDANFDFDKNGVVEALTDGLLLLRYAFGYREAILTENVISQDSTLSPQEVISNIEQAYQYADIDNDGSVDALTDGLILLRYAFGLRGDSLIDGVIIPNAGRTSAADIETYIESHMP